MKRYSKTSQFMIGDYVIVKHGGATHMKEVCAVTNKKVGVKFHDSHLTYFMAGVVEPVTLNNELIELNGFVESDLTYKKTYAIDRNKFPCMSGLVVTITYSTINSYYSVYINSNGSRIVVMSSPYVKYLHELQHMLRPFITNKEDLAFVYPTQTGIPVTREHEAKFEFKRFGVDEDKYWEMVAGISWPMGGVKGHVEYISRFGEVEKLCLLTKSLRRLVQRSVRDAKIWPNGDLHVSDDSFWDINAHVVGLGKDVYYGVLNDPNRIHDYSNSYKENFEYCFHN